MKKLSKEELININGGAISWSLVTGISAAIVFIVGIIDGIVRPVKCYRKKKGALRWS